ncbi:hypothetical protein TNIN_83451, partial [Trichonephila inaurata madagascariensis]
MAACEAGNSAESDQKANNEKGDSKSNAGKTDSSGKRPPRLGLRW